jgi:hypothetical protein
MEKTRLLLIFTRNPELGKCKTRLASVIGERAALEIYLLLLQRTAAATQGLSADKMVCYSEQVEEQDLWDPHIYRKTVQQGSTLGERMENAFREGFTRGYKQIIIIGSDLYDLRESDLETAFHLLEENDCVIGPATDGGYYLLGMKAPEPNVFRNKDWGSGTVLDETVSDLKNKKLAFLPLKNDVDEYEDIQNIPAFLAFIKQFKND